MFRKYEQERGLKTKWLGEDECGQQTFCSVEKEEFLPSLNLVFILLRHLEIPFLPATSPPLGHQMSGFHCEFEFLQATADAVFFLFFLFVNACSSEIISLSQAQPRLENLILNMKIKPFVWAAVCAHGQLPVGALWFQFTLDWVLDLGFLYIYEIYINNHCPS